MNHHFANVGANISKSFNYPHVLPPIYSPRAGQTLILPQITQRKIVDVSKKIKGNFKQCLRTIPSAIIKRYVSWLSAPLKHCMKLSVDTCKFPDWLKNTVITPLFKKGDKTDPSNRRPISSISFFAKMFEIFVNTHLIDFLESNKILHPLQFGFRKHNSTSRALLHMQNIITSAFDQKLIPIGVFLDIAKAFDSVDHNILLYKLEHYGIRINELSWFKSYLENRKHKTFVNGTVSTVQLCNFGVPQGSNLAPILFLIYINDLYYLQVFASIDA